MNEKDTERLIVAIEDVAEQVSNLNFTLRRFMEIALAEIDTGDHPRSAMRIMKVDY